MAAWMSNWLPMLIDMMHACRNACSIISCSAVVVCNPIVFGMKYVITEGNFLGRHCCASNAPHIPTVLQSLKAPVNAWIDCFFA